MKLTVRIGDRTIAEAEVAEGQHFVGRGEGSLVQLDQEWVSRVQVSVEVQSGGSVVTNGFGTRMRAVSCSVQAVAAPGGSVWAQGGGTLELSWPELPHELTMTIESPRRTRTLPRPRTNRGGSLHPLGRRTRNGRARIQDEVHRQRLAILFRYLLLGLPRPRSLYAEAAARSGVDEATLRQTVRRVTLDINAQRTQPLRGVDSLGYYLVETTRELRPEHLPDEQASGEPVSRA